MTQLSPIDANFIHAETKDCPMHIASVQVLDLPTGQTADEFVAQLKSTLNERRGWVPYLTSKLQWSAGWLGHPRWIKDRAFNIDNHIRSVSIDAPGRRRQVEQAVARLHEAPLERSRPLWEIVVLTGLCKGRVALYNRVHHACVDGMAGQAATQLMFDPNPEGNNTHPKLASNASAPQSLAEHAIELFFNMGQQAVENTLRTPQRAASLGRLFQQSLNPNGGLGAVAEAAPQTRFNRTVDRSRSYAIGEVSLNRVKLLAKRTRTSVNDVFLSLCAGGLRRYLARHHELPKRPLIAGCPVSLRDPKAMRTGNQVTFMQVSLGTDIGDPVERLLSIHRSSQTAKTVTREATHWMPESFTLPGLGALTNGLSRLGGALQAADFVPPPFNVVISNVPGPRERLYCSGARMLTHYPVSIPAHGQGLNITVQSYHQQLFFAVTACQRLVPDADLLRDDLLEEFRALNHALSAEVIDLQRSPDTVPLATNRKSAQVVAIGGSENEPRVA